VPHGANETLSPEEDGVTRRIAFRCSGPLAAQLDHSSKVWNPTKLLVSGPGDFVSKVGRAYSPRAGLQPAQIWRTTRPPQAASLPHNAFNMTGTAS
jgi:hypothetical protein